MFSNYFSAMLVGLLDAYDYLFFWAPALAGGALLFGINAMKQERKIAAAGWAVAALPGLATLGLFFVLPHLIGWYKSVPASEYTFSVTHLLIMLAELAAGFGGAIMWFRVGEPATDKMLHAATKKTVLERNKKTDIRKIGEFIPSAMKFFDPCQYFDLKKGLFVGLDEAEKPIYIKWSIWEVAHFLISGRTRSGKGVVLQSILVQAIMRKELVVILDPKIDNYMPHIYHAAATDCGQPYVYLDLNPTAPPQMNIFAGCDAETVENMLLGAFSLSEKGDVADFYRLADRKAARQAAHFIAGNKDQPAKTAIDALAAHGAEWAEKAPGFHAALEELASIPAINSKAGGIDILSLERTGGCLYTVGDLINSRVIRIQRMLLVRLLFLAKKRDYMNREPRLITVLADEFKVHISRPFMLSLGASAGWRLHCILAFQSLQDLADCPADLDKESVRGSVMENCAVQLSYAIKDPDTADWLARSTGIIQVDDETRKVAKNIALAERIDGERTIRQSERFLMDTNILTSLPIPDRDEGTCGAGVLAVAGQLAKFCYTSRIVAKRTHAAITPNPVRFGDRSAESNFGGSVADSLISLDQEDDDLISLDSDIE